MRLLALIPLLLLLEPGLLDLEPGRTPGLNDPSAISVSKALVPFAPPVPQEETPDPCDEAKSKSLQLLQEISEIGPELDFLKKYHVDWLVQEHEAAKTAYLKAGEEHESAMAAYLACLDGDPQATGCEELAAALTAATGKLIESKAAWEKAFAAMEEGIERRDELQDSLDEKQAEFDALKDFIDENC